MEERKIVIRTGTGGYEMFQEGMENQFGLYRIYIGKKVMRILRISKIPIKKSLTGRYYKLLRNSESKKFEKMLVESKETWKKELEQDYDIRYQDPKLFNLEMIRQAIEDFRNGKVLQS